MRSQTYPVMQQLVRDESGGPSAAPAFAQTQEPFWIAALGRAIVFVIFTSVTPSHRLKVLQPLGDSSNGAGRYAWFPKAPLIGDREERLG